MLQTFLILTLLQVKAWNFNTLLDSAYVVGEMNAYLGLISADTTNPKSIMNLHGEYGDDHSSHSIFGEGSYAGLHGAFSPFNRECEVPPKIYMDSVFVAYLTENERLSPRISPSSLLGWLYERAGIKGKVK